MEYRRLGQGRIRCFYMHELQIGIYQREKFSKNTDKNTDIYSDNTRKTMNIGFRNGYSLTDKNLNEKKVSLLSKISQKTVEKLKDYVTIWTRVIQKRKNTLYNY